MEKIKREIFTISDIVKNAPHTESEICGQWTHGYTREEACFPNQPKKKFWPAVARIDNVYGDRNLVCSCSDYFTQKEKTPVERLHDDIRKSIGKI